MWQSMGEFILKLHAQGLSHEAVIEIMIALLGVMIAVLALIAGLITVAIAVLGVFGFTTIRDEAGRQARQVAAEATERFKDDALKEMWAQVQASGVSEGQAEMTDVPLIKSSHQKKSRRRATTDKNLKESGE